MKWKILIVLALLLIGLTNAYDSGCSTPIPYCCCTNAACTTGCYCNDMDCSPDYRCTSGCMYYSSTSGACSYYKGASSCSGTVYCSSGYSMTTTQSCTQFAPVSCTFGTYCANCGNCNGAGTCAPYECGMACSGGVCNGLSSTGCVARGGEGTTCYCDQMCATSAYVCSSNKCSLYYRSGSNLCGYFRGISSQCSSTLGNYCSSGQKVSAVYSSCTLGVSLISCTSGYCATCGDCAGGSDTCNAVSCGSTGYGCGGVCNGNLGGCVSYASEGQSCSCDGMCSSGICSGGICSYYYQSGANSCGYYKGASGSCGAVTNVCSAGQKVSSSLSCQAGASLLSCVSGNCAVCGDCTGSGDTCSAKACGTTNGYGCASPNICTGQGTGAGNCTAPAGIGSTCYCDAMCTIGKCIGNTCLIFPTVINVTLNYPQTNSLNTSQSITHGYTSFISWGELSNCTLFSNYTGAWNAIAANSTQIQNNTATNITFNYAQDIRNSVWNVYCYNQTGGILNYSTVNFTLRIDTPPTYSSVGTNDSNPLVTRNVSFYSQWNDWTTLSNYIFSWNGSGAGCDTWANETPSAFQAGNWTNTTKIIQVSCGGKTIGYRFYANDTSNNLNDTGVHSIPIITPSLSTDATNYSSCGAVFYTAKLYTSTGTLVSTNFTEVFINSSTQTVSSRGNLYPNSGTGTYLGNYQLTFDSATGQWLLEIIENAGAVGVKEFSVS